MTEISAVIPLRNYDQERAYWSHVSRESIERRNRQRARHLERLRQRDTLHVQPGTMPRIRMFVSDWSTDELGNLTRFICQAGDMA